MTLIGPCAQCTPHAPAMNVCNLSYFVTGTYTNIKSGCHHHQIGMDYLWAPFSKWPPSSTTIWAGINDPWNLRDWSLPSIIIVRGPAVTPNKSQLVDVMNEVWCSDAFAPKFVLRKVFRIARSQLLVGEWWWDNTNINIWAVFVPILIGSENSQLVAL